MDYKRWLTFILLVNFSVVSMFAQCSVRGSSSSGRLINELGIVAGPLIFKSNYLSKSKVDFDNVGLGVGIVHYLNFSSGRQVYFNDHFKIRNEVVYQTIKLENNGTKVNDKTKEGAKLAAMHGKTKIWEIGTNLEWYPFGITRFQNAVGNLTPYANFGIHFVHYSPEVQSNLGDGLGYDQAVTPKKFLSPIGEPSYINTNSGNTFSLSGSLGLRYKIGERSDLQLDFRLVYYGSSKIEGIDTEGGYNDAMAWMSLGYIYYL